MIGDFKKVEKNVKSYKKYEKGGNGPNSRSDNDSLVAKAPKMGDLVGEVPEKLHISSPAGSARPSAKKAKPGENPLHTGEGKPVS